jgi:hypothetical protein
LATNRDMQPILKRRAKSRRDTTCRASTEFKTQIRGDRVALQKNSQIYVTRITGALMRRSAPVLKSTSTRGCWIAQTHSSQSRQKSRRLLKPRQMLCNWVSPSGQSNRYRLKMCGGDRSTLCAVRTPNSAGITSTRLAIVI